jgi:hypothetical protein
MQAAFSRLGAQGLAGTIPPSELAAFLALAAGADSTAQPSDERADALARALREALARSRGEGPYTLADVILAARSLTTAPSASDAADARPRPASTRLEEQPTPHAGSPQLRELQRRLERNRLTMPMFDTKGWVADFEKSLTMQWEIYANGLQPMNIIVGRSDHVYGRAQFDRTIPGFQMV